MLRDAAVEYTSVGGRGLMMATSGAQDLVPGALITNGSILSSSALIFVGCLILVGYKNRKAILGIP